MLEQLRPFFRDDWTPYGESLQLRDASPVQPSVAQWLADPVQLEHALACRAQSLNAAGERAAVASDWMLSYLTALLPPIVALSSLLKYSVPTDWRHMTVTLNESQVPAAFSVEHIGTRLPAATAPERYGTLVWQHLDPLIAHVSKQAKVPAKILRGNARRALLRIFGQAVSLAGADSTLSRELIEDRRHLLESRHWPDGRRNPLYLRQRQVRVSHQGKVSLLTLHASCCLAYRLPSGGHCDACPLARRQFLNHTED